MVSRYGREKVSALITNLLTKFIDEFYLPKKETLNVAFFQDLITGAKQVFKNHKVNKISPTKYPELSNAFALAQIKECRDALMMIPNHWYKPKAKVDREYIWSILATVLPEWTKSLLQHADRQRFVVGRNQEPVEQITVCTDVIAMFSNSQYLSSK